MKSRHLTGIEGIMDLRGMAVIKRVMRLCAIAPVLRSAVMAVFAAGLGVSGPLAMAQSNVAKPIKLLVGYAPGGAVDILARNVAQSLAASLAQPVVVENKPGAGTNIATQAVIAAAPDGHTLLMASNALAANMSLYQPQPYDALRDLKPVALVARIPVVLAAHPGVPYGNLKQLMDAAKAHPNAIAFGTAGNGSTPHMAMELFERLADVRLQHIPYKGGAPAITDAIGGQVPLVAVNALEAMPHVRTGKLKLIAVLSAQRSADYPDVPTVAESGFAGFEASVWYGIAAPAQTPAAVLHKLHGEVQKALATQELRDRITSAGGQVAPGSAESFAQLIQSDAQRYARLVREAHIKPD
jgi:tripartite-type tricarboxylate transporter receptor subunit TctC